MTQNSAGSSKAEDVLQKAAVLPGGDNKARGTIIIKPPNPVDPDVVLQEGASEEEKAAWERFFAELEIWRQKRYERTVDWFRRDFPGQEPPPREDKNWARSIVMNHPTGILTGTGPPLPPGFPPGPTKEEIRERQRQEQP
ncbi:hypothetical protein EPUS_08825 [Endocarpon pusillum Z07020]|uniref:Uncharacterized protein n=1 Tax=Endocarpon pusillum (strain Z07020 / HMAS-L-300199) TaxID=1263415 RepID=U1FWW2_ENDPU|nr:uncharacterized protein EPUS_08825 [Endocarpon pusillum Z07020]ERF69352.1 hypothetical protein EPUS_08825 [Endocarpon pusillum Z07020]